MGVYKSVETRKVTLLFRENKKKLHHGQQLSQEWKKMGSDSLMRMQMLMITNVWYDMFQGFHEVQNCYFVLKKL